MELGVNYLGPISAHYFPSFALPILREMSIWQNFHDVSKVYSTYAFKYADLYNSWAAHVVFWLSYEISIQKVTGSIPTVTTNTNIW
jgi:hypothetical protein